MSENNVNSAAQAFVQSMLSASADGLNKAKSDIQKDIETLQKNFEQAFDKARTEVKEIEQKTEKLNKDTKATIEAGKTEANKILETGKEKHTKHVQAVTEDSAAKLKGFIAKLDADLVTFQEIQSSILPKLVALEARIKNAEIYTKQVFKKVTALVEGIKATAENVGEIKTE